MNKDFWKKLLVPDFMPETVKIEPGLFHKIREEDGKFTRYHLRVEPDGSGMLVANATAAVHLSLGGVIITKGLLEDKREEEILDDLIRTFQGATLNQHRQDISQIKSLLNQLDKPGDIYPIINLEDAAVSPYSASMIAPLEASLPLASPDKITPIIQKLWDIGIPHVTFIIQPGFSPAHLLSAVDQAEQTGLICGVSGRASELNQKQLIQDLAQAGLDHLTAFYASANDKTHDQLFGEGDHAAVAEVFKLTQQFEIADVGHIPLIPATLNDLDETLEVLLSLQVPNAAFFAVATADSSIQDAVHADGMRQVAAQVDEDSAEAQVRYIWEPPIERNPKLSIAEQVQAGPRCPGDLAVRIETDGSVIPPRGPYKSAGNILTDSWDHIWQGPSFKIYRERVESPTRCDICPGLTICAADCPREPRGWSTNQG